MQKLGLKSAGLVQLSDVLSFRAENDWFPRELDHASTVSETMLTYNPFPEAAQVRYTQSCLKIHEPRLSTQSDFRKHTASFNELKYISLHNPILQN